MLSKFRDLEIDASGRDVFETPDVEIVEAEESVQEMTSSDIENSTVKTSHAIRNFQKSIIDAHSTDFSDKIGKSDKSMYSAYHKHKYLLLRDLDEYTHDEGDRNLRKLNPALLREKLKGMISDCAILNEIIDEIPENEDVEKQTVSSNHLRDLTNTLQHELSALTEKLNKKLQLANNSTTNIEGLTRLRSDLESVESKSVSLAITDVPVETVSSLESRIAHIEKLVGVHHHMSNESLEYTELDDGAKNLLLTHGNLVNALNGLDEQVSVLNNPSSLEAISKRIANVTTDLDKLIEIRKRYIFESSLLFGDSLSRSASNQDLQFKSIQTEQEKIINEIYKMMQKIDGVAEVIPHLVTRLTGLKKLHSEASTFSHTLNILSEGQANVEQVLKTVSEDTQRLKVAVERNEETMIKNMQSLEARLSKRVN